MRIVASLPLLVGILLATTATISAAEATKPNIVVILADDYGYGSAGCYGADGKLVQTPSIDRLAKEGRRFTDGNTTSSVCSPTRYSLLTGRYCWRTSEKSGVLGVFSPLHIESTRLNMASLLKKHGYQTAAIGKWHLGYGKGDDTPQWRTDYAAELSPGPLDIGFDYHFSVPANHGDLTGVFVENRFVYGLRSGKIPPSAKISSVPDSDDFKSTYTAEDLENSGKGTTILALDAPRRVNERVMPVLTDKAVHWIEQQKAGTPFFLYYTPVAVHNPITPAKDLAGKSAAGPYGDFIHELDRSVGRILETLDRQGLAKDTLVIFTSDNGGVSGGRPGSPQLQAEEAGLKINGALRGRKHSVWEGGFKVPFVVRWPGRAPAGTVCDEMVSVADLLATAAAIVGEKLPAAEKAAEDSYNILPAILGEKTAPIRADMIVHSSDGVYAIRKGQWKWVEGVPVDDVKPAVRKQRANEFRPQLYNTHDDPAESKDVSAENSQVVAEMAALLNRYRDGGYSRELPPVVEKRQRAAVSLPPVAGEVVLREPLDKTPAKPWSVTSGEWKPEAGGLAGAQPPKGADRAGLRAPLGISDGIIDYEIRFHGATRHSLRIEAADRKSSFRVEISRAHLGLTKIPAAGDATDKIESLARKPLELTADHWYPVRITFRGAQATAQVGEVSVTGSHPVFDTTKGAMNLFVFGDSAAFRNVVVTRGTPQP